MTLLTIALTALTLAPRPVPPSVARRDDWTALAAATGVLRDRRPGGAR